MTTAEKEARVDRYCVLVFALLVRAQERGRNVEWVHHAAAAHLWWNGRGRTTAMSAGRSLVRGIRAGLAPGVSATLYVGDVTLAYLAGIIDADGTIGVKKSTYGMRHGNGGQPNYSERVSVRQVEPEAIDLLATTFGGSRYMTKPNTPSGRPLHTWAVTDKKAAACLLALSPFLRIKLASAMNAIELRKVKIKSLKRRLAVGRGHVGSAARPAAIGEAMERLYVEAKRLNLVGVRE